MPPPDRLLDADAASLRGRREADLFFADLLGVVPPAPRAGRPARGRAQPPQRWDDNASLVPALAEAEPRLAALAQGRHLNVAGFLRARTPGTGAPSSLVVAQEPARTVSLVPAAGNTVEPHAPLSLFHRGSDAVLATVLAPGIIGMATGPDSGAEGWTAIAPTTGTVPALRHSRALKGVSLTDTDSQLFCIGSDDRLYVKRLGRGRAWADAQLVDADLVLHPFSSLAVETRAGHTVYAFVVDRSGSLTTAFWASWFGTPFPSFLVQRLNCSPSLLPGSALAAVSPHADHVLVFGVGRDRRLAFSAFAAGVGWRPVATSGSADELLNERSRLAAHALSATEVELAAFSDTGRLVVYRFHLAGTNWTAEPRLVVADPPARVEVAPVRAAGSRLQAADGFSIDPCGDIVIFRNTGRTSSTVLCAGMRAGVAHTLLWNAEGTPAGHWQAFV